MKKIFFALIALALFSSHDMYLKMDTYFLQPATSANIKLFNGTFDKSENVIDRDRMTDVSLLGNGNRSNVNEVQWIEKDSTTILNFRTGEAGTWVAGVSTAPRTIEMTAADFNNYLEHDGVQDMLDQRRKNNKLETDAAEKYSKHVKAIFQVGDKKTNDWQTPLGYPIEFIPLSNPYELNTGDSLQVKLLRKGEPLADQLVYANYKETGHGYSHKQDQADDAGHHHEHDQGNDSEHGHPHEESETKAEEHENENEQVPKHGHSHGPDQTSEGEHSHNHDDGHNNDPEHGHSHGQDQTSEGAHSHTHDDGHNNDSEHGHSHGPGSDETEVDHQHISGTQLRTNSDGIINVGLKADGMWYLRTINLVNSEEPGLTHESNWATLTFEVTHAHGEASHSHTGEDEEGIPTYVYWIGSFLLLGGLFFWFNRKN